MPRKNGSAAPSSNLREFFSRRCVTLGASGLGVIISANAVQAPLIGLASTISVRRSNHVGTVASVSTSLTATKTIAMTFFQKLFFDCLSPHRGGWDRPSTNPAGRRVCNSQLQDAREQSSRLAAGFKPGAESAAQPSGKTGCSP